MTQRKKRYHNWTGPGLQVRDSTQCCSELPDAESLNIEHVCIPAFLEGESLLVGGHLQHQERRGCLLLEFPQISNSHTSELGGFNQCLMNH